MLCSSSASVFGLICILCLSFLQKGSKKNKNPECFEGRCQYLI